MLRVLLLAVLMVHYGHGHTYHTGQCPQVAPMPEFDMKRVRFFLLLTFDGIFNSLTSQEPQQVQVET